MDSKCDKANLISVQNVENLNLYLIFFSINL